MYALKYLPKLDKLPSALRNEVFEKLFEQARIAKMTRKEQNNYYKSLHDMGIVRNQISKMENTIAVLTQDNAALIYDNAALTQNIVARDSAIAEREKLIESLQKELAEVRRQKESN
jgi:ribosomal protein S3AE